MNSKTQSTEWRTVPVPITEEMHTAACKVMTRAYGFDGLPQRMLDAMLNTAPTPPKSETCKSCETFQDRIEHLERKFRCHSKYATRPILYTDGVNGDQCCRDDLWAISTEELNRLSFDRNAVIEECAIECHRLANNWNEYRFGDVLRTMKSQPAAKSNPAQHIIDTIDCEDKRDEALRLAKDKMLAAMIDLSDNDMRGHLDKALAAIEDALKVGV